MSVGSASGSPLPVSLGSIGPGAAVSTTLTVPATAGPSGSAVIERFAGTYTGGTFGGSERGQLP
jgi:hypothetical protein